MYPVRPKARVLVNLGWGGGGSGGSVICIVMEALKGWSVQPARAGAPQL
jgi:hypothetical protein